MHINFVFLPLLRPDTVFSCGQACQLVVNQATFRGENETVTGLYDNQCNSTVSVQSYYQCMRSYCSDEETSAGVWDMNQTCIDNNLSTLPPMYTMGNVTVDNMENLTLALFQSDAMLTEVASVDQQLFNMSLETVNTRKAADISRELYGYCMYIFWAGVIAIGMLHRACQYVASVGSSDTHLPLPLRNISIWIKRWIITPATFSHHVAVPIGWCTIPTRLQSIVITAFVALNIVICFISYDIFDGNLYWPDRSTQFWRHLSDRTGAIATANLPLVFVFAVRNNVILWVTGWSNATFKQFHRWVARVATLEAFVHSVGFSVLAFQEGGISDYFQKWVVSGWRFGVLATVAMLGMCAFSILPIRRRIYEFFLTIHIILAAATLIGIWYHIERFGDEYRNYILPCIAVWVFDRLARGWRVLMVNIPFKRPTASYDAQTDIIRLSVPVNEMVTPRPGAHYYIYMLKGGKFMESHPFTLSSWTTKESSPDSDPALSFVIRPYNGFTGRLKELLQASDTLEEGRKVAKTLPRMLVEGPYGSPRNFEKHDSILFILGGLAITVAMSYIRDLAEKARQNKDAKFKSVKLVWVLRDLRLFQDILDHDIEPCLSSIQVLEKLDVQFDIYITAPVKITLEASPSSTPCATPIQTTFRASQLYGRPSTPNSINAPRFPRSLSPSSIRSTTFSRPLSPGLKSLGFPRSPLFPPKAKTRGRKNRTRITAQPLEMDHIVDAPSERPPNQMSSRLSMSPQTFSSMFSIQTSYKRPALQSIVSDFIFRRGASGRAPPQPVKEIEAMSPTKKPREQVHKMAIVACGTPGMADDCRAAVVAALALVGDGIDLDYYPEMFGW